MSTRTRLLTLLAVLATVLATVPGGGAIAQVPEVQPGLVDALCPRAVPLDDDCYTLPLPAEVWAVAATLPIRADGVEGEEAIAAYDSLIPEPFFPIEGRREIGVLMFRLNPGWRPDTSASTDPGEGYAEGSVAIRVGFPAEEGHPYSEGWFVLAQPLNDPTQYDAGRDIGLPKYMADAGVRQAADGTMTARALDWGHDGGVEPGRDVVADGNVLRIDWSPDAPDVDAERADQLRRWGQYGEALFVQNRPWDEDADHSPGMVKFTVASIVPVSGAPVTPVTTAPDPRIGTATVTLEGTMPDGTPFEEIIEPGPHTVAGTSAFSRGYAFITADDLSDNGAG